MQVNMEFEGKNETELEKVFKELKKATTDIVGGNLGVRLKKMHSKIYSLDKKSNKLKTKSK